MKRHEFITALLDAPTTPQAW